MLNEWSHANQLEITAYRQINAWINKDFIPKQGEFRNVKLAPLINDDLVRSKSSCLIDYSFKAYHQLLEIIFSNPIYD